MSVKWPDMPEKTGDDLSRRTLQRQRSRDLGGSGRVAMADQIMVADKSWLKSQLGTLSKADLLAVEDAIKIHLALPR